MCSSCFALQVFLDWQDMHDDLKNMQDWYLRCIEAGQILPPTSAGEEKEGGHPSGANQGPDIV
jgi:hypothetical protein